MSGTQQLFCVFAPSFLYVSPSLSRWGVKCFVGGFEDLSFCVSICVCVSMLDQINVCVCMWGMERGLGSCSVFCPSLSLIFSPFPNQLHSVPVLPLWIEKRQRDWEVRGIENSPRSHSYLIKAVHYPANNSFNQYSTGRNKVYSL